VIARKFALEQEKIRAAQIAVKQASKQLNNQQTEEQAQNKKPPVKLVPCHDANSYATTRYHVPDVFVDKFTQVYFHLNEDRIFFLCLKYTRVS
jgi:hypothetical protein